MENRNKLTFLTSAAYYICIAVLSVSAFKLIPLFWPFLISLLLAYMFKTLAGKFMTRTRAAAIAAGILFYFFIFLIFWLFAAVSVGYIIDFAKMLPDFYSGTLLPYAKQLSETLLALLRRFAPASAISLGGLFSMLSAAAQEVVTELSSFVLSKATALLKGMPIFFIGFVFTIVSSFAIAMDYDNVIQFLMRQIPHRLRPMIYDIKNFLLSSFFKLVKAYTIILLITYVELCIGLWALRIPSFWKYATVISLLDLLPILGSGAILIPWGLIELLNRHTALGVGLLILYAVTVVVRNIAEPHIVGDSLGLHPAVTLTAMFFGLKVFGIIGMLIVPVIIMLIRFLQQNNKIRLYR